MSGASGEGERSRGATIGGDGTPWAVDLSGHAPAQRAIALFLSGPVIWSLHFMAVYLVVDAGCTGEGPGLELLAPPVAGVFTLAATAVAAVACLGCAALAYRRWRADRRALADGSPEAGPGHGTGLVFIGFTLALLGFVHVLFVGLPALVLPAC